MARRIDTEEYDAIVATINKFPGGVTGNEIAKKLTISLNRRTLQRRLTKLVADKKIQSTGKGPHKRYFPAETEDKPQTISVPSNATAVPAQTTNPTIKISSEGKAIFRSVTRPVQQRKRVSYNRNFLDSYRPNETFYLPASLRQKLGEVGRVADKTQPAGTYARQILHRLLIDLSFNSSRLEGNTYSLLDTKGLIEAGKIAVGKDAEETQMIMNHKAAIEFLVESAGSTDVNKRAILSLHALLSDNLLGDPGDSGRLRKGPVEIGGSVYLPLAVPQLIEECFNQVLNVANLIEDPFEQSFFFLVHIPYLQPFEDVNKRVSRLCANIPLIKNNLKPLSFVDLPQGDYVAGLLGVYEMNRIELLRDVYEWAYVRSTEQYAAVRQSLGAPDEFKLRYRTEIKSVVGEIIRKRISLRGANEFIANWARQKAKAGKIEAEDQAKFAAVVESELGALHEGNVARFPVTPNEFDAWLATAR